MSLKLVLPFTDLKNHFVIWHYLSFRSEPKICVPCAHYCFVRRFVYLYVTYLRPCGVNEI